MEADTSYIQYQSKTFRLSLEAIEGIYSLQDKLSNEMQIPLSQAKVLELIIFYCLDKNLVELTKKNREK